MAKKPTPAPVSKAPTMNMQVVKEETHAANVLAVIERSKEDYEAGRDLANQMLGQIQMSRAISKFTDVVSLSKLKIIKENKIYRSVAGQKAIDSAGNEIPDVGTWVGFCAALGVSASKIDEDLANLKMFGEEALEQMHSTGIGYRELRQFRRLPADQQGELIEAAKAGDTATLLELAEDLMAKHIKEKAALQQDLAAKDQRIARHAAKIQELEDKEDRWAALAVYDQVAQSTAKALGVVQGELRQGFLSLVASHKEAGDGSDSRVLMAGHLGQLQQLVNALREEFALADVVGDGTPEWKKWNLANPNGHPNIPDSATWRPEA